jgi:hypothetical protein
VSWRAPSQIAPQPKETQLAISNNAQQKASTNVATPKTTSDCDHDDEIRVRASDGEMRRRPT